MENEPLKYLIVGVGAVGGALCSFLSRGGKSVTCLFRKEKAEYIKKNGLTLISPSGERSVVFPNVCCEDDEIEEPDVVFVCVKSYSIESIVPFLQRVCTEKTVVIPLLNVYTTGQTLQKRLPDTLVTDGCVYIAAGVESFGEVKMHGDIFRVVFGKRDNTSDDRLKGVYDDLTDCGVLAVYSDNIRRDAFAKFVYVSSQALCGQYYDVTAGEIQSNEKIRTSFRSLLSECILLGKRLGIKFTDDEVQRDMDILDDLLPSSSTSMQRDIAQGKSSEIQQLVFDVVDEGKHLNVDMPVHLAMAKELEYLK